MQQSLWRPDSGIFWKPNFITRSKRLRCYSEILWFDASLLILNVNVNWNYRLPIERLHGRRIFKNHDFRRDCRKSPQADSWARCRKNDLTECTTINDLIIMRGHGTPENHPLTILKGFSTVSEGLLSKRVGDSTYKLLLTTIFRHRRLRVGERGHKP
jgi:hypothetical protein